MTTARISAANVVLENRGPLKLRDSDYLATGGEGSVYRANATVIKIYTDLRKMRDDRMPEKLKLLSKICHQYIVSPEGLVYDTKNNALGFYMPYVDAEPLSRIFTNDFRKRVGFGDEEARRLVERMRETVQFAHDYGAILADANELNWLVLIKGNGGPEPRVIDVDSWAIQNWKAKVIMPSIKDWHSKEFSALTDWFSWGVVTFQVFTGIHPYKGRLDGYLPSELERRMKDNASVFAKGIRLNHAVRDFNSVPGLLLEWYEALFQKGERGMPPSPYDIGIATPAPARILYAAVTTSGALVFEKLFEKTNDPVIRAWPSGVCLLASGALVDFGKNRAIGAMKSQDGEIIKVENGWLVADFIKDELAFSYISESSLQAETLSFSMSTKKIFRCAERLFAVTDRGITELVVTNLGKQILSPGQTWNVMINATKWFDGVGIQDALGSMFLVAPFGDRSCVLVRTRELDGLRPITAKAGQRFITVIALDKRGAYQKIEFAFERDYTSYKASQTEVDSPNLNIAILPKGVSATITEDGELVILVPASGKINKVEDKNIRTDMELSNWQDIVLYIKDGGIWKVRMK